MACQIWNHIGMRLGKVSSFDRKIKKRTSLFKIAHHRKMRNSRSIGSSLFHTTLRSKTIRYSAPPGYPRRCKQKKHATWRGSTKKTGEGVTTHLKSESLQRLNRP
ncbi:hypothetical protein TNIN_302011 [Trichonephila inaurata madagascariensis]|uniref:Uncharacterized protein n=1 Tax=Trichonephila inaurata madagascariensis TaxID=2747483 RepID=A0A8X6Y9V1_9ARAC|nr:hypothetical protein TNIN_302011 [Trichonephila inaurata madagascariensis]